MSILKVLTDLYTMRQNARLKNTFASIVYNLSIVKEFSQSIKKLVLKINGKQTVKLESGSIKFKNHFKQLAVPFKIYAALNLF